MKKLFTLIAAGFISLLFSSALTAGSYTWIEQSWENNAWQNDGKVFYDYDGNKNLTKMEYYEYESGEWVPDGRITFTYDANGNNTSFISEHYENSAWIPQMKSEMKYDNQGNETESTNWMWKDGAWAESFKEVSTYQDGKIVESVSYMYQDGAWTEFSVDTYTYEDNKIIMINQMSLGEGEYMNMNKEETFLNHQGLESMVISYDWDFMTEAWKEAYKDTYTYDAKGNEIESVYESWENGEWKKGFRHVNTYNEDDNIILDMIYEGNESNEWELYSRSTYEYNQDKELILYLDQFWENEEWINEYRGFREGVSSVFDDTPAFVVENYPNPAKNTVNLTIEIRKAGSLNIKIINQAGQFLGTLYNETSDPGIKNIQLNIGSYPAGSYFLLINNHGSKVFKKITVVR